jgi:multisubunit Na+/H+ antiporter MnhE subunit
MRKRLLFWIAWYVPLVGLWLLFVVTLDPAELLLGVVAAAIGATAQEVVNAQDLVRFRLERHWLRGLRHLPKEILVESWLLAVVLWRQLTGRRRATGEYRYVPFPADGAEADDAGTNARRALVTIALSLAPNTYVIGIEGSDRAMLIHQLLPRPGSPVPASMAAEAWR